MYRTLYWTLTGPMSVPCCCWDSLRVALLDEAYDVRAAGLRAMRHFIFDDETARSFIHSNQVHLVVRSLDINLDNKIERLQALRLLRHLIAVLPLDVPVAAARAVVAIARDGLQDSDNLTRPCWATIAELCLRVSPSVFLFRLLTFVHRVRPSRLPLVAFPHLWMPCCRLMFLRPLVSH